MGLIEITGREQETKREYSLGHYLTMIVAVLMLLYGINLRSSVLGATTPYVNVQAGIEVSYPANWLIDFEGDYVFRVRDMQRIGYKTTIQINVRPIGPDVSERNVLDALNITRPNQLSTYNPLAIEPYLLPDETPATAMTYTFVDTEPNPFLEGVPTVVTGQDILTLRGGQAIIITFRADSSTFDEDIQVFNRMLASLEF